MRVVVPNTLSAECSGWSSKKKVSTAKFNLIGADGGKPGGFHLVVHNRDDPRADRHLYFSQSDRVRIAVFLLSGISLPDLNVRLEGGQRAVVSPTVQTIK